MSPGEQAATPAAPTLRHGAVEVRVPATSANLGPGFDAFGLALGLYDHLTAMVTEDPGVRVVVEGEGAGMLPEDESHLVARAMGAGFAAMGLEMPGVVIRCVNTIPHGRGLGSSAAAIVAGIVLARALVEDGRARLGDTDVLDIATRLEGHPDNVAAALLGGFTTAWLESTAEDSLHAGAVTRAVHPDVVPIVAIPAVPVPTAEARRILSEQVSRDSAVFNVGRAALLVHAVSEEPGLLMSATEDRLHQAERSSVYPESHRLVVELRSRGIPAVISGAGPTVLALVASGAASSEASPDASVVTDLVPQGWRCLVLAPDLAGVQARVHGTGDPA